MLKLKKKKKTFTIGNQIEKNKEQGWCLLKKQINISTSFDTIVLNNRKFLVIQIKITIKINFNRFLYHCFDEKEKLNRYFYGKCFIKIN